MPLTTSPSAECGFCGHKWVMRKVFEGYIVCPACKKIEGIKNV